MERTQPDPSHEAPQPSLARYGRGRASLDVQADRMLLEMADRLEANRPDEPLTSVGRIALIQATTVAPPLASRLRARAPEITALITRRAYSARLREIVGPVEPAQPRDLPPAVPVTEDRGATAAELLDRAAADYARAEAARTDGTDR